MNRIRATALLVALAFAACADEGPPPECTSADECGDCEACVSGACQLDEAQLNFCGTCGPGPEEVCGDGLDNNCNGTADEGCWGFDDPCREVVCQSPPDPACEGSVIVSWSDEGTCDEGECTYERTEEPCPNGCKSALCLPDPCAGVVCSTAPSVCWKTSGTCVDGGCIYEPNDGAVCDDKDPCTGGDVCTDGACAGTAEGCSEPPPDVCVSTTTLRVYAKTGVCEADGSCFYEYSHVTCDLGCDSGACKGDPCAGVPCDAPPGPCYDVPGSCGGGACNYEPRISGPCDDGDACTVNDACTEEGCVGEPMVCDAPPAPACNETGGVRAWSANGACVGGECFYQETDTPCAFSCEGGACGEDICLETVCESPPGPCYGAPGTCDGGACSYPFADGASCDDGDPCTVGDACASGVCAGVPMVCDVPAGPSCLDASTLRTWSNPGECVAGDCEYPYTITTCEFGCKSGACKGDPCANVSCDLPPTACHAPTGTCASGVCTYKLVPGNPCNDGDACTIADTCGGDGSCAGVMKCVNPSTPGSCLDVLTSYQPKNPGDCSAAGACSYPMQTVVCEKGCDPNSGFCVQ